MPEVSSLRRHSAGGETVVSFGGRLVFHYADGDIAMRNLAISALREAGVTGLDVAKIFGLSPEQVSRLHTRVQRDGEIVRRSNAVEIGVDGEGLGLVAGNGSIGTRHRGSDHTGRRDSSGEKYSPSSTSTHHLLPSRPERPHRSWIHEARAWFQRCGLV